MKIERIVVLKIEKGRVSPVYHRVGYDKKGVV